MTGAERSADPGRLSGTRIAVTGAAGSIGSAIARAVAAYGGDLALIDCDPTLPERAESLLPGERTAVAITADLSDAVSARDAILSAWRQCGGLDGLVNVAGIYPTTPAVEVEEAEWDRVLGSNLKAAFFCAQTFAREAMAAERPGRIVNVSSTAARLARPGIAHYGASKAGMEQLTRVLALEWAESRILVNAVAPGVIATERVLMASNSDAGRDEAQTKLRNIPMGRFGTSEEVAELVVFLLTGATYCTGATFTADGGYTLGLPRYDEHLHARR